jgi:hypothetical protein
MDTWPSGDTRWYAVLAELAVLLGIGSASRNWQCFSELAVLLGIGSASRTSASKMIMVLRQTSKLSPRRLWVGLFYLLIHAHTTVSAAQMESASSPGANQQAETRAARQTAASGGGHRTRLSDSTELDQVIELYMAGSYEQCTSELELLLRPEHPDRFTDPGVVERGRLYYSTCALMLGDRDKARQGLRAALEENPLMSSPDSLTFPPPLVSLFLEVRDEVQQLISDQERQQVLLLRRENESARRKAEERRRREEQLEKLATEETVIRSNSRFIAALPLGAGQFQNGSVVLGTVLLVTESLAVVTSITSLAILTSIQQRDLKNQTPSLENYNKQTQALYQTMKWSTYSALALYALGVIEAQLNFKAEIKVESRKRPLPPEISGTGSGVTHSKVEWNVLPSFGLLPRGVMLGAQGSF